MVEGGGYLRTLASAQAIPNGGGVFAVEALELTTGPLKTLRDRGCSVALWQPGEADRGTWRGCAVRVSPPGRRMTERCPAE